MEQVLELLARISRGYAVDPEDDRNFDRRRYQLHNCYRVVLLDVDGDELWSDNVDELDIDVSNETFIVEDGGSDCDIEMSDVHQIQVLTVIEDIIIL